MSKVLSNFENPFRPGAGHRPPYLAGRAKEIQEFDRLLRQKVILENMVLTGLRGVGKTVLLDSLKPKALQANWLWVGTDLSESATISENSIAIRLLTDLSVITSNMVIKREPTQKIGFNAAEQITDVKLNYNLLKNIYDKTPGLVHDKLKSILEFSWSVISRNSEIKGVVFAYDEAQNLSDQAGKEQYPLSLLLDVFQSIQKKEIPFMLLLTGLPTLFPKLIEARTFSERMFRVVFLDKLNEAECIEAITKPIENDLCPVRLTVEAINVVVEMSGGYPYFIQFMCREIYDVVLQKQDNGEALSVPVDVIIIKLDTDFFSGRWSRVTDRQKTLLYVIAQLDHCDDEFTVAEIVAQSKKILQKPFSSSHVNQMLSSLSNAGLIFKNRHGKYSFAVPLMSGFINRQPSDDLLY
ncbi:MAG: hypothetical protein CR997_06740 [Acidobacteria bacterium]|nr:MAG: hypothetical protein CR997_06740 [Acidobacteriota bacterium]